jgi:hypothetical protein
MRIAQDTVFPSNQVLLFGDDDERPVKYREGAATRCLVSGVVGWIAFPFTGRRSSLAQLAAESLSAAPSWLRP